MDLEDVTTKPLEAEGKSIGAASSDPINFVIPSEAVAAQNPDSPSSANKRDALACSLSHQILTLIGFSFVCFEIVFLTFYFDKFWFSLDLSMLGVIAILILCFCTHFFLKFFESNKACSMMFFLFKGKPPVPYRRWICLSDDGFTFGIKHIRWDAVDEMELSWFGNLIVKSRMLCGAQQKDPDVIIKLPFGIADNATQIRFIEQARAKRPQVILNKKLLKVDATLAKGAQITQIATAAIMSFVLLDVGYASFYYLELLKNLYLAETRLLQTKNAADPEAVNLFERAENLRQHPLPISWVTGKFLNSSTVAAGLCIERAKVLWLLGKKDEALQLAEKSFEYAPTSLRHRLYKARLLVESGKPDQARVELDKLIEQKESALLPRLYLLALAESPELKNPSPNKEYENQLAACYAETFGEEPYWPPGGNRFFTELWYSEDLRFLMDRFLSAQPDMERVLQKATELEKTKGLQSKKE